MTSDNKGYNNEKFQLRTMSGGKITEDRQDLSLVSVLCYDHKNSNKFLRNQKEKRCQESA